MPNEQVTQLLDAVAAGDPHAASRLLPLVYEELRKLARSRMSQLPPNQTLQPTALVHEAFVRIAGESERRWSGRAHFFFVAARAMKDILVEQARRRASLKRGGNLERTPLADVELRFDEPVEDVLALSDALERLEGVDAEAAQVVMLRYFSGLTAEETADVLDWSLTSVERKWRYARAWLRRELAGGLPPGGDAT